MTEEQIRKINYSFKHGDELVFTLDDKVYVAFGSIKKHKEEKTVEIRECHEVDNSCFTADGEYYGDFKGEKEYHFFLKDPYAKSINTVASVYYLEDIVKVIVHKRRK